MLSIHLQHLVCPWFLKATVFVIKHVHLNVFYFDVLERVYDFFFCNKVIAICSLMLIETLIKYLDDPLILFVLLCDKRKGRGLNCLYHYFISGFCPVPLHCLIFVLSMVIGRVDRILVWFLLFQLWLLLSFWIDSVGTGFWPLMMVTLQPA